MADVGTTPFRPGQALRAMLLIFAAVQVSACTVAGSDRLGLSASPLPSPAVVSLAPAIDPTENTIAVLDAGEEAARLAQLTNAPPPSSTGAVVIQGEPVYASAPPEPYGYEAAPYGTTPVYVDEGDPLEHFNRQVFHFNDAIDTVALEPLARTYRHIFPAPVRGAVRNFAANLESPVTLANDVLQGEWDRAHVTFTRFVINSTLGVAGFHDPASQMGFERHREDFDQTLALHGWSSGPYLVVPVLGPATPRHLVGRIVDSFFHPLTWILAGEPIGVTLAERAAEGVVAREEVLDTLDVTKSTSTDYYVAIRSFYRQNRISEINNGHLASNASGGAYDMSEDLDLDF